MHVIFSCGYKIKDHDEAHSRCLFHREEFYKINNLISSLSNKDMPQINWYFHISQTISSLSEKVNSLKLQHAKKLFGKDNTKENKFLVQKSLT